MDEFPKVKKTIENYLYEEEGNITRNKLLMIGSLALIMSCIFALDASAGHSSHKSHSSHSSSSHSSGHASHASHVSHTSSTYGGTTTNGGDTHSNTTPIVTPKPTATPAPTAPPITSVYVPQQAVDNPLATINLPTVPNVPTTITPDSAIAAAANSAISAEDL